MAKKISEEDKKELIAKKTIAIFRKITGRHWGASFLPDHDVLTLIESYFEAREKVSHTKLIKEIKKIKLILNSHLP